MNKKYSLLARLMLALLVFGTSTNVFQSAKAHIRIRDDGSPVRQALKTSGLVQAIIELDSAPVVERMRAVMPAARRDRRVDLESADSLAYEAQVESEQANFKSRAALASPGLRIRTEMRVLANAISIEAPGQEVAAISALPGVKRVELVKEYQAALDASVPLINAPAVWDRLGGPSSAGEGVKIAILDTGIDITNSLFSDAGYSAPAGFPKADPGNQSLTNNKVIAARAFVPGTASAQDENGHGTNVAGIAAGNFNTLSPLGPISGVAPRAFLGNYRVLRKDGKGTTDGIAAAIDQAVKDGFDILSLSLGGPADSGLDFLSSMVEAAVADGRIVTVAAGNAGTGGTDDEMTISSPGIAPSAITVAASSNSHIVGPVVTVTAPQPDASNLPKFSGASGNGVPLDNSIAGLPLADPDPQRRGCNGFQAGSLNGKVALIERGPAAGGCSFAAKVDAAAAAGARAVIIFNYDASENPDQGGESFINMEVSNTTIPSLFVQHSSGLALRNFARANPTATLSLAPLGSASAVSDIIAAFSSRGPSSIQGLKPDIAAPGVIIYSGAITTPNADGVSDASGFAEVSGTSQATPHVAGAAALIKQLHPSWTPAEVKSALMSSAMTDVFTTVTKTTKAGVLATGAGRVDLNQAANVAATFAPASLSFGIVKLKKKVSLSSDLNIKNVSDAPATFTISVQELDPGDGVVVSIASTSSVLLAPGQSAAAKVSIDAKKSSEKRHYTGYIVVTSSTGQTQRVPYWVRFKKKV